MKTIGIIGGIAPESTIDYYRRLLAGHRERQPEGDAPAIIINSIDLKKMVGMIAAGELPQVTDYLVGEVDRLVRAGADCGLLASNTPHIVFDEIDRRSPIPMVSIVAATCAEAKKLGLKKLGLIGTRFTMQGHFYPDVFSRAGITLAVPTPEEQEYAHDKYMNELVPGKFLPATRERMLAITARMKQQDGIEGMILGGTELPLLLTDSSPVGIPFLDTTGIHVRAVLAEAMA